MTRFLVGMAIVAMAAGCATPVFVTEKFTVEQGKSLSLVAAPRSAYVMRAGINMGDLSGLPKDMPKTKGSVDCWLVLGAQKQTNVVVAPVIPTNNVPVATKKSWWRRK